MKRVLSSFSEKMPTGGDKGTEPNLAYLFNRGVCRALNSGILFAFVALLIVVPWAYAVLPLVMTGIALIGWFLVTREKGGKLDAEDGWWCVALVFYSVVWLVDVWRSGAWPIGEGNQGVGLPLWPCLAVALLVWLRYRPPSPTAWWLGVGCGALGAGSIALLERFLYGQVRANNDLNSIPFGNLSLLLGVLSLVVAAWLSERGTTGTRARIGCFIALLAASGGIGASLLSGTRGGWLAVPLLLWIIMRAYRKTLPKRQLTTAGALVGVLFLSLLMLPQAGIAKRIADAANELEQYWLSDYTRGSVGTRLEMWRGGILLFAQAPLMGWGEAQLAEKRDELIASGRLATSAGLHDQLHNDFIDTAARRGVLGLASLLLLYAVPIWLFWRRLSDPDRDVRALAVAGILIPIAFMAFGLSQSMLRDVRGLAGYLGLSIGVWAILRHCEARDLPDRA